MSKRDAKMVERLLAPDAMLKLEKRGIKYVRLDSDEGCPGYPGVIKIGSGYYVHGVTASTHAAAVHLSKFRANVFFGHTHRAQMVVGRTVQHGEVVAASPGTLSKLQPLYMHSAPTEWSHGIGVQFDYGDGLLHLQVPIIGGKCALPDLLNRVRPSKLYGRAA